MSTRKLPTFRELVNDIRAYFRGERRIAPYGSRGRVYARSDGLATASSTDPGHPDGVSRSRLKAHATLHMKITRADGTVEHREVPATMKQLTPQE